MQRTEPNAALEGSASNGTSTNTSSSPVNSNAASIVSFVIKVESANQTYFLQLVSLRKVELKKLFSKFVDEGGEVN